MYKLNNIFKLALMLSITFIYHESSASESSHSKKKPIKKVVKHPYPIKHLEDDEDKEPTKEELEWLKTKRMRSVIYDSIIHIDFDLSIKDKDFPWDAIHAVETPFDEIRFNPKLVSEKVDHIIKEINNWKLDSTITNNFPTRLILFGPPGTGKTTIAEMIARNVPNCALLRVSGSNIVNRFQGSGPETITKIFKLARDITFAYQIKVIIFIDEINFIAQKGEEQSIDKETQYTAALASLWTELDMIATNPNFYFICATNTLEEDIHPTFRSRFGRSKLFVPPPDEITRRIAIDYFIEKINKEYKPFTLSESIKKELIAKTKNFSIRTIKNIVYDILREGLSNKDIILKDYQESYEKDLEKIKKDKYIKERADRTEEISKEQLKLTKEQFQYLKGWQSTIISCGAGIASGVFSSIASNYIIYRFNEKLRSKL